MTRLPVPPEFQRQLVSRRARVEIPEAVAALEMFAKEMTRELGDTPQLYQINRARLALADRHELLRRGTPARSRGKLTETFNRCYAELFDRFLSLQRPELAPPLPPPIVPPEPPRRKRTVAEAMAEALGFDDVQ